MLPAADANPHGMVRYRSMFQTLLAAVLAFFLAQAGAAPDPDKVLRVGERASDEGFDPVRSVNYYSGRILDAIGEPLLTYDYLARPAKLVPGVAEAMPEVTDAGRTYTFRIRKGVHFAPDPAFKGKPRELTAADFVYGFKRFLDPRLRAQWRYMYDGKIVGLNELAAEAEKSGRFDYDKPIDGLQALDRYTLRIRLTRTDYNFPYILAMSSAMPMAREVVEVYGDQVGAHPVGTNAYMLAEYKRGHRIVLDANPNYRGFTWDFVPNEGDALDQTLVREMKGKQMPRVSRVEISIIEEDQSRYLAFLDGQLDYIDGIQSIAESWRDGDGLKPDLKARGISRDDMVEPECTYAYFNFRDPVVGGFSKERIALRRAMIMAYDIDAEIKVARKGLAVRNTMPIPRGVVGYNPNYKSVNPYDPDAANKLLDKFGYKRGADGWRTNPDGSPLVITRYSEPESRYRELDEVWLKSLEKIGIRLAVRKQKFAENLKAAKQCQLQTWGSSWIADYPDGENFLSLLYGPNSGQSNNGCYDSPVYNKLYEMSIRLPDSPKRNKLYELMTRQMEYDGAWSIGISRIRSTLTQPWLLGYRKHPVIHAEWKYTDIDLPMRAAALKR
jgi:ABC-type transport system substrate-binding protein